MEPFKNLISAELVALMADQLCRCRDRNAANRFSRKVLENLQELELNKPQTLSIDYVLHMLKANGSSSQRVFKGGVTCLEAGAQISFSRTHKFREVTTHRHYPGTHAVHLRINGVDTPRTVFELACA